MAPPQPLYFGSAERPLFGWLHLDPARAGRTGLLICNPFGYESLCAHRTLRQLAQAAADAGIPSLRFDYDGSGDSAGSDADPQRFASWVSSVRAAGEASSQRGYCRQARNPSANARSPGVPFSSARMARRLLL